MLLKKSSPSQKDLKPSNFYNSIKMLQSQSTSFLTILQSKIISGCAVLKKLMI